MELNLTQLIEKAQRNLGTREKALKVTLAEIELLEGAGAPPQAIVQARLRRDRQHNACQATLQLLDALQNAKAAKKNK